jgi:hypothetical protein
MERSCAVARGKDINEDTWEVDLRSSPLIYAQRYAGYTNNSGASFGNTTGIRIKRV